MRQHRFIEFVTATILNRNMRWHARGRSNSSSTWFDKRGLELAKIEAITVATYIAHPSRVLKKA